MKKALLILLAFVTTAFAGDGKLAPELKQKPGRDTVQVIIQFRHAPSEREDQKISQHGGTLHSPVPLVNGVLASMPASRAAELSDDPDVIYISPDRQLNSSMDKAVPAVNAQAAWNLGYYGNGVGIALIDSGVQDVSDLQNASRKTRIV